MKTPRTFSDTESGTLPDQSRPQPDPATWHKAVLPKMAGHGPDGARRPARAMEEWRPGDAAKRGYEKAVEDWWWL